MKLTLATATAMAPTPCGEDDLAPVDEWARHVRIGQFLTGLTLEGRLVPASLKADGEPGFLPTTGIPPSEELEEFLAEVKRAPIDLVERGWRLLEQATGEGMGGLITEAEEKCIRLATAAGVRPARQAKAYVRRVLEWFEECSEDEGRLNAVLAGQLLPVVDPENWISFRAAEALSPAALADYHTGLQRIKEMCK